MSELDKKMQDTILADVLGDVQAIGNKVQTIQHEKWGDDKDIGYKDVQDLLYLVKVIEQRLKYLGGVTY